MRAPSFLWPGERPAPAAAAHPAAHAPHESGEEQPRPGTAGVRLAALWEELARAARVEPGERLLVALSGGADSVLLLHLVASARPRPDVIAVHVDHGLRGAQSDGDARFCRELCRALDVELHERRVELDPDPRGLEARAREARYGALFDVARVGPARTILTGHHADDALETLLLRWVRGTHPVGLAGLRARRTFRSAREISVVRPLLPLRREEVRALLEDAGLAWREDDSNGDLRFARNRARNVLLPALREHVGPSAVENLFAFTNAVGGLEESLSAAAGHLRWEAPRWSGAGRTASSSQLGGSVPRGALMRLSPALRRHALSRLILDGTGRAPSQRLLARLLADLGVGRCARHTLPAGFSLQLRADQIHLRPPRSPRAGRRRGRDDLGGDARDPWPPQVALPFPEPAAPRRREALRLAVPGVVLLPDGRRLIADTVERGPCSPPPPGGLRVELDLHARGAAPRELVVRWRRAGDRFRGLGAPGSKPLGRFLADAGVPREDRDDVPLVTATVAGGAPDEPPRDEILWVAGVRPADPWRVHGATRRRLRLELVQPAHDDPAPPALLRS